MPRTGPDPNPIHSSRSDGGVLRAPHQVVLRGVDHSCGLIGRRALTSFFIIRRRCITSVDWRLHRQRPSTPRPKPRACGAHLGQWSLADYDSVTMTDANTQLASNRALVSLGSQPNTLIDTGLDESSYYWSQYADGLSSNTSFLTNWYTPRYTGDIAACGSPS